MLLYYDKISIEIKRTAGILRQEVYMISVKIKMQIGSRFSGFGSGFFGPIKILLSM